MTVSSWIYVSYGSREDVSKMHLNMKVSGSTNFKEGCMLSTEKLSETLSIKQIIAEDIRKYSEEMNIPVR